MKTRSSILSQPLGIDLFRSCFRCKRWFALVRERVKRDERVGKVVSYRCKNCNATVDYADHLPPGVI